MAPIKSVANVQNRILRTTWPISFFREVKEKLSLHLQNITQLSKRLWPGLLYTATTAVPRPCPFRHAGVHGGKWERVRNGWLAGRVPVIHSFHRLPQLSDEGSSGWWSLLLLTNDLWLSSHPPPGSGLLCLWSRSRLSTAGDSLWPVQCAALLQSSFQGWFTIGQVLFCLCQWSLCPAGSLSADTGQ